MNYLEVYFNGVLKQSLPVKNDVISIGRAADNDIVIDNMGVSSHHAVISKKNNHFHIEDLNSTNGTFLNNQNISSRHVIKPHDAISIGKHTLKFSDWTQSKNTKAPTNNYLVNDSADETIVISKRTIEKSKSANQSSYEHRPFYLIIRGELMEISKQLLTKNNYGIGKHKDNEIRIGGWFTPAYIAEIEKIGHSYYVIPLKKNMVKLNNTFINSSTLLAPSDEIKIKKLYLKFLTD